MSFVFDNNLGFVDDLNLIGQKYGGEDYIVELVDEVEWHFRMWTFEVVHSEGFNGRIQNHQISYEDELNDIEEEEHHIGESQVHSHVFLAFLQIHKGIEHEKH